MNFPKNAIWKLAVRPSLSPLVRPAARAHLRRKGCIFHLDTPEDQKITNPAYILSGWFAFAKNNGRPSLRVNDTCLTWVSVPRPDVAEILGENFAEGFRALLDVNQMALSTGRIDQPLTLELVVDGRVAAAKQLLVESKIFTDPAVAAARRGRKREWLMQHIVCPICLPTQGQLSFGNSAISCNNCGQTFPFEGGALDFLPQEMKAQFQIADWTDISAHAYDDVAARIIEEVRKNGGKVLDCGAGLRSDVDETVICLDVAAFPTVDILAVNQRLPFRDAVFDAVLSLNVLEHVTDPFTSASELVRVLKPHGRLYCCIPFLQPEHGFPHHYFNATRSGLRQLFSNDLDLIDHFVPGSGEPVWSLQWFLSWYAKQLPVNERNTFLDLRMRDVVDRSMSELQREGWVTKLSSEGRWKLASTTAALFRKRGRD